VEKVIELEGMRLMKYSLLVCLIPAILVAGACACYPFIHNFTISSYSFKDGRLVVSGRMDVYFTKQAWDEFGYKQGNFYWFNLWWQQQVGKVVYNEQGTKVKLVSVTWTLLKQTKTYDTLGFNFTFQIEAAPPHFGDIQIPTSAFV
jgi:hypothetical protein